mmetsp:Transcript_21061/g.31803  ORF Transcript_21061/g.31803 Transcript_21061/m.31803 type:complete len:150 (+) Transcript_21061:231-680(+)
MYDTWLINLLQNLVRYNHGTVFCPSWMNSSEIRPAAETQGIVPLHSKELGRAINSRASDLKDLETSYSNDVKFLASRFGVKIPCLPFKTREEDALYTQLLREDGGRFDANRFALQFAKRADGKKIFPKTTFYLRAKQKNFVTQLRQGRS